VTLKEQISVSLTSIADIVRIRSIKGMLLAASVDVPPPSPDVVPLPPSPHPVPPPEPVPPEIIEPPMPGQNAPIRDPIAPTGGDDTQGTAAD
jgi:splicing factor 3A subunit 2